MSKIIKSSKKIPIKRGETKKEEIIQQEEIIQPEIPPTENKSDLYQNIFNTFSTEPKQEEPKDNKKHIEEEDLIRYQDKDYSDEDRLNYKNMIQAYYLNFPELKNTGMINIVDGQLELDHYSTAELNFIADAIEYYLTSGNVSDFVIAFVFIFINVYENCMKLINVDLTGLSETLKNNQAFIRNLKILKIKYSCYMVQNIPVEYLIVLSILQTSSIIYMKNLRERKIKEELAKKELEKLEKEEKINDIRNLDRPIEKKEMEVTEKTDTSFNSKLT